MASEPEPSQPVGPAGMRSSAPKPFARPGVPARQAAPCKAAPREEHGGVRGSGSRSRRQNGERQECEGLGAGGRPFLGRIRGAHAGRGGLWLTFLSTDKKCFATMQFKSRSKKVASLCVQKPRRFEGPTEEPRGVI